MTDPRGSSLDRFKSAQASAGAGFDTARAELASGGKHSHWIWYIFPQLAGLGQSAAATHYGLQGVAEAAAYLRDPLLRGRLLDLAIIIDTQLQRDPPPALDHLMGSSVDAVKLVSSMTLFHAIAQRLAAREPHPEYDALVEATAAILAAAGRQGYEPCAWTLARLEAGQP